MNAEVRVLGNLNVVGSLILDENNSEFPLNPKPGTLVIKGLNLFAYLTIGGMQTWYPLVTLNGGNTYIHNQGLPMSQWTISHNLDTAQFWYQCQDELGQMMFPSSITPIDANSFMLNFASPVIGQVVVVGTDTLQLNQLNASLIKIGAEVVIDILGMSISGSRVLSETQIDAKLALLPSSDPTAAIAAGVAIETARAVAVESTKANLSNNIYTGAQAMTNVNKGTVVNGTVDFNISQSNVQELTVGGALAVTLSNWPATGIFGDVIIAVKNGGAYAMTMPNVIWQLPTTGAPAASFSAYLTAIGRASGALQVAGTDFLYFYTLDGGVTIYGKVL